MNWAGGEKVCGGGGGGDGGVDNIRAAGDLYSLRSYLNILL